MNISEMEEAFRENDEEYGKFSRIPTPRSTRPDLNAFLLLNELVPSSRDIVFGAEHDVIYLSIPPEELAAVVTSDQIVELVRCGVLYTVEDRLRMFV